MKDIESIKLNSEENDKLKDKLSSTIINSKNKIIKFSNIFNSKKKYIINKLKDKLYNSNDFYFIIFTIIINAFGIYYYLKSLTGCRSTRAFCLYYYTINLIFKIFLDILKASISFSIISIFAYWKFISFYNLLIII